MGCAKASLLTEGVFGRHCCSSRARYFALGSRGNMDVMLNHELVAAHVDQMSVMILVSGNI